MSDLWYRDPPAIPPYEDFAGNLWTWDGVCLNPVHTCEPPRWHFELVWAEIQAEIMFGFREAVEDYYRRMVSGEWRPRGLLEHLDGA